MSSNEHLRQDLQNFGAISFSSVSMTVPTGFFTQPWSSKKVSALPEMKHTDPVTLNK